MENCITAYSIKEFREFEGIWEHSCILECYFNETGVIADPGGLNLNSTVNQFKSNPYLSATNISKCVQEGEDSNSYSHELISLNSLSLSERVQQPNGFSCS